MMGKVSVLAVCIASLLCLPLLAQDALDLDGALALIQNDHVAVSFDDAGKALLEDMIAALLAGIGVTDELNQENEDRVMEFEVAIEDKEIVNYLSQAYYTLANVFIDDGDEAESVYLKGKHWGLKSLRMDPAFAAAESADGFTDAAGIAEDYKALYWGASNWLRVAQRHPMQALIAGVPPKTQVMSERALELAPEYILGGSYRALGAYYSGLPVGRDLDKTLFYFCHIVTEDECANCADCGSIEKIANADDYFENRTFIAEFYYMEKNMWAEAKLVLDSVLAEEVGDLYPLMNAYAQENARELLATVEKNL